MGSVRGPRALAALPLAAGLVLAGCGTTVAGSDAAPPVLRIGTGTVEAGPALAGGGTPDGRPTLAGSLPPGPASAAVYRYPGGVDEATVVRLAAALSLAGTPQRKAHGWVVRGGDGELAVRDDGAGAWAYARGSGECGPMVDPAAPADDGTSTSCALPVPPGRTPSLGPDAGRARAAAAPVLAAVGLAGVEPQVAVGTPDTYVAAIPVVEGLPTTGIDTSVTVSRDGIVSAQGVLATPQAAQQYPLISAKAAFAALASLPRPEIAIACPDHVDGPPLTGLCARPVVTGAVLGLTLRSDDGEPVLVPAWLFSVRGSDNPITMVAVAGHLLGEPSDATGSGSGSSSGSEGAVEQPGDPGPAGTG